MLMPKRVFVELGGMDEDYFLHVEDIDFCLRVEKINGPINFFNTQTKIDIFNMEEIVFIHAA